MKEYYWATEKIKLISERKKYAKRKWEELFDIDARKQLQHIVELPPIAYEEYEKKYEDCNEINPNGDSFSLYVENFQNEFVGWINVQNIDRKNGTFSIGIGIFKDFQRKGYGNDTINLVLGYCFNELRLNKCNSECLEFSIGSLKVHTKVGFKEEGRRRQCVYMNGKYHDIIQFGITSEEYNQR